MNDKTYVVGYDIGGTKCAAVFAAVTDGEQKVSSSSSNAPGGITFLGRAEFPTRGTWEQVLNRLIQEAGALLEKNGLSFRRVKAAGVSCGGPLDSKRGLILSPPNLPGWDGVSVTEYLAQKSGIPAKLRNDADAGAVAEYKFGAGRGYENVLFLTFGTGLGCGMVLNGRLYSGANDGAGEAGHIRLESFGPVGYGKAGSFEGFCSGGGIRELGKQYALEKLQAGKPASFCPRPEEIDKITAKNLAELAKAGDADATDVYRVCGEHFGKGLAVLVDLLNPEIIIAGGVYMRSHELIYPHAMKVLEREALPLNLKSCKIVPSALGEKIGDYAAVSVALL
ncbi:N-acylmannosamine kinase [Clostridia bacterium]|nr:N-acylmannosamine kinase [Clostridia bacterium]